MKVDRERFFCVLLLFMVLVMKAGLVLAGIKNSPHDVILWYDKQNATGVAGTCAYCHVPHSSKGDRLFPEQTSADTAVNIYGTVGAICAKCHRADYASLSPKVKMYDEIFLTLGQTKSNSTMDSHPTVKTKKAEQTKTLQNTSLDSAIEATSPWPWIDDNWKKANGGKGDDSIECTSCHNPHNWNTVAYGSTAQRKFLRAPIYDSAATNGMNNFCVYCHKGRQSSGRSNASGTHPVSSGEAGVKLDPSAKVGLYKDDNKDTGYGLFRSFCDSATLVTGNRDGKGIWDKGLVSPATSAFLGARLAPGDQIICQSCHMPHGVMHSNDDTYQDTSTAELNVGPLLAINNATNLDAVTSKPTYGPSIGKYPENEETTYCLDGTHEQNLLCEWCHGMTPDLESNATDTSAFAHPVNKYPSHTNDNMAFESEYGTLYIKYPPGGAGGSDTGWVKYRESSGIRGATDTDKNPVPASVSTNSTLVTTTGRNTYLTCLSCHEPHQAWAGTPILKKGGWNSLTGKADSTFCDGCHDDLAMGNKGTDSTYFKDWTTHPSGPTAKLKTSDARAPGVDGTLRLPNRAGLRTFGVKGGDEEYISCWTCHRVHDSVEPSRAFLADYQEPFSQICVNCHCEGDTDTARVSGGSRDAKWKYGTGEGETNANPSRYYIEGAVGTGWWSKKTSGDPARFGFGDTMRLGSHYIGQFTGGANPRPEAVTDDYGWLGEREIARETSKLAVTLRTLDHRTGQTEESGGESKDRWLDTSSPMFTDVAWYGSGQKSHIGVIPGITDSKVIICQTCHAVHNTATGVADDSTVSRLLLAPNYDSYMCKRCHIPEAEDEKGKKTNSHPMHADTGGSLYGVGYISYNTTVGRTKGAAVDVTSGTFAYTSANVKAPANYPYNRMSCDACHTPHNADSKMGAMIVEGDNVADTDKGTGEIEALYTNKLPTTLERNDKRTCDLCHKQGTASE